MKNTLTLINKSNTTRKMKFKVALENLVRHRYTEYLKNVGGTTLFLNKFLASTRDDEDLLDDSREEFSELMSSEGIRINIDGLKLDSLLKPIVSLYIDFDLGSDASWEVCSYCLDLMPNGQVVHTDSLLLDNDGHETHVHSNNLQWEQFATYVDAATVLCSNSLYAHAALISANTCHLRVAFCI